MQQDPPTLDYAVPPARPPTRWWMVTLLLGLICLFLEVVNERADPFHALLR